MKCAAEINLTCEFYHMLELHLLSVESCWFGETDIVVVSGKESISLTENAVSVDIVGGRMLLPVSGH